MPIPVLIDTDAGVDDALALVLALRSPEIRVHAVTTVAGNVDVRKCTRNVLALLHILRGEDGVPVAEGASKPLLRKLVTAPEVHGRDGFGNARPAIRSTRRKEGEPARDVIVRLAQRFGRKLTIIALGPLTNIAIALKSHPHTMRNIGHLVSMGGAFRVAGNTGPVAEFNYYVDPEAAHQVLNSGIRITVVPLDITQQVVLMRRELERRAARRANPISKTILRMTKLYMQYHLRTEGFFGGFLHDPLAVAAAVQPSLVQTQRVHVDVETRGILTRGMSVADFRKQSRGQKVDVALKFDKEEFLKLFHERLWA